MNELTLSQVARALAKDRKRLADTLKDAAQVAITSHSDGVTEVEIARTLGVNRMTVRRWLGKL